MRRASLLALLLLLSGTARAGTLEGVTFPTTQTEGGRPLALNGIGLRTASVFHVKVYVAGLYLEQRQQDGDAVIRSSGTKVLEIRFLRDIDAEDARAAWVEGFEGNCRPPCRLDQRHVAQFLAAVPSVRAGDSARLAFDSDGLRVSVNGKPAGVVQDKEFVRVILATFIGRAPPTEALKRALLGRAN